MEEDDYNPNDYDEDGFLISSPFRCNEVAEIYPLRIATQPELAELVGKRGVVKGYAENEGEWSYGVAIQSGKCWYLDANELRSIKVILTQEELYGPPSDKQEWARINSNGECVAGDPSFLKRGPTPLFVDLEKLAPTRTTE